MKTLIGRCRAVLLALALSLGSLAVPQAAVPAWAETVAQPSIAAPAGIVMNADTHEILYQKDADTAYYPASITKTMTALLVVENCSLDEVVTFSKAATTNLESGAVSINLTAGDQLTVRDCLYALLLKSANEVANGLAEHVSGSVPAFADLMNRRARELGCTNTHFANPNGLNDSNHYTTAHDMALITAACFSHEILRTIDTTPSYRIAYTINNPNGVTVALKNKILMSSNENYYPYALAGKTGYTSRAGSTLVTYARRDGVNLVAVVLKSTKYMGHYSDTRAMLEYGFAVGGTLSFNPQDRYQTSLLTSGRTYFGSAGGPGQTETVSQGTGTSIGEDRSGQQAQPETAVQTAPETQAESAAAQQDAAQEQPTEAVSTGIGPAFSNQSGVQLIGPGEDHAQ